MRHFSFVFELFNNIAFICPAIPMSALLEAWRMLVPHEDDDTCEFLSVIRRYDLYMISTAFNSDGASGGLSGPRVSYLGRTRLLGLRWGL